MWRDLQAITDYKSNDEMAYREEVRHLGAWYAVNSLTLNSKKTKKLIVNFNGMAFERLTIFQFLGVHASEDFSWTFNAWTHKCCEH